MHAVDIICLANSRKHGERCVAGYDMKAGCWLRPVSNAVDGSLERRDRLCADGGEPRLLDLLRVWLNAPAPRPHQPENWLLAAQRWQRLRPMASAAAAAFLTRIVESGPELLGGPGDRLPAAALAERPVSASLAAIEPEAVEWQIRQGRRGNRQTRACFILGGTPYDLAITDIDFELHVAALGDGRHPRTAAGVASADRVFFTISLGEPFERSCYKLVAAVMVLRGTRG